MKTRKDPAKKNKTKKRKSHFGVERDNLFIIYSNVPQISNTEYKLSFATEKCEYVPGMIATGPTNPNGFKLEKLLIARSLSRLRVHVFYGPPSSSDNCPSSSL